MSKRLEKKLIKLRENNVICDFEPGSTRLGTLLVDVGKGPVHYLILDIPEKEAYIQHEASRIRNLYESTDDPQLTKEHRAIIHAAGKRLFWRALDLFDATWSLFFENYVQGDKACKAFFKLHLLWFVHEMFRHADQWSKECELEKKYGDDWKGLEKEMNEWTASRENKTRLWSNESFTEFIQPAFKRFEEVET